MLIGLLLGGPSRACIWSICDIPPTAGISMHCQIMLVRRTAKVDAAHAKELQICMSARLCQSHVASLRPLHHSRVSVGAGQTVCRTLPSMTPLSCLWPSCSS